MAASMSEKLQKLFATGKQKVFDILCVFLDKQEACLVFEIFILAFTHFSMWQITPDYKMPEMTYLN